GTPPFSIGCSVRGSIAASFNSSPRGPQPRGYTAHDGPRSPIRIYKEGSCYLAVSFHRAVQHRSPPSLTHPPDLLRGDWQPLRQTGDLSAWRSRGRLRTETAPL